MRPTNLIRLALVVLIAWVTVARGDIVPSRYAELRLEEDHYVLDTEFGLALNPTLEEAIGRGIPLYFVMEFELSRPRWYWFDEKPVKQTQTYKITYTPLLRQYRLSVGSLYQNFTRFDEVKRVLSRVRGWHVADKGAVKAEGDYQANLRLRLDTGQLPKPFQLNAVASSDWALNSEWHRWTVNP